MRRQLMAAQALHGSVGLATLVTCVPDAKMAGDQVRVKRLHLVGYEGALGAGVAQAKVDNLLVPLESVGSGRLVGALVTGILLPKNQCI